MNLTKNNVLRSAILSRLEQLQYSYTYLIKDADERGMKISPGRLSKYVNGKSGGVTEEQLLWIATRLGIEININFGKLVFEEGKPTYKIGPYSELEALQRLNKIFPKPSK